MNASIPLNRRTIALVGLMGVGKSTIGRRLALALGMPFRDADVEIEAAAGRSVTEIFSDYGEAAFRDGEQRVIARLLDEPPHVLATGGGALIHPATRESIRAKAVSIWLKTDLEVLVRRLGRRGHRPLLIGKEPLEVLRDQAMVREPLFARADIVVETGDTTHQATVDAVLSALKSHLASVS